MSHLNPLGISFGPYVPMYGDNYGTTRVDGAQQVWPDVEAGIGTAVPTPTMSEPQRAPAELARATKPILTDNGYPSWRPRAVRLFAATGFSDVVEGTCRDPTALAQARVALDAMMEGPISARFAHVDCPMALMTAIDEHFMPIIQQQRSAHKAALARVRLSGRMTIAEFLNSMAVWESHAMVLAISDVDTLITNALVNNVDDAGWSFVRETLTAEALEGKTAIISRLRTLAPMAESFAKASFDSSDAAAAANRAATAVAEANRATHHRAQQQQRREKGPIKCHRCGELGHPARLCDGVRKVPEPPKNCTFIIDFDTITNTQDRGSWVIDSGASASMTAERTQFLDFKESHGDLVQVANKEFIPVLGVGTVALPLMHNGRHVLIKDVLFVPDLGVSLLAEKSLTDMGWSLTKRSDELTLQDGTGKVLITLKASAVSPKGLFLLKQDLAVANVSVPKSFVMPIEDAHRCLGHANEKYVRFICAQMDPPILLSPVPMKQCETCIRAKLTTAPQAKAADHPAKDIGDILHADLIGPMRHSSMRGFKYASIITDGFSRMCHIRLLKTRMGEEVAEHVEYVVKWIKSQTNKDCKVLRSDSGLEYDNPEVEKVLRAFGMEQQLTARNSPAQNGLAERKNRTIVEGARAMMLDSNMSKGFWDYALEAAVFVQNRLPHRGIDLATPYETFYNEKPVLAPLRPFGAPVRVLVETQTSKASDKTWFGRLIGFERDPNIYLIWNPATHRVCRSSSVKFLDNDPDEPFGEEEYEGCLEESEEMEEPKSGDTILSTFAALSVSSSHNDEVQPTCESDTPSLKQALASNERENWLEAIQNEMNSHRLNDTAAIVDIPEKVKLHGSKIICKRKRDQNGNISMYKARWVIQGFSQVPGRDYEETYAPVVNHLSLRAFLHKAAHLNMEVHNMDVQTAYLNAPLKEEIYVSFPKGFEGTNMKGKCLRLKKSVYGLKQAGHDWHQMLKGKLIDLGWKSLERENCIFIRDDEEFGQAMMAVYVDDMLIAAHDNKQMSRIKEEISHIFNVKDMGEVSEFLGMKITRDRSTKKFFLSQEKYANEILEKYASHKPKYKSTIPMGTYLDLKKSTSEVSSNIKHEYAAKIGSLLFIARWTRPDMLYAVTKLAQFASNPSEGCTEALDRTFAYLRATADFAQCIDGSDTTLKGLTDASFERKDEESKSTTGNVIMLGSTPLLCRSKKQTRVALSTTCSEIMALVDLVRSGLPTMTFLNQLWGETKFGRCFRIACDSKTTIANVCGPKITEQMEYLMERYNFVRESASLGEISMEFVLSKENVADIFTKALPRDQFEKLRSALGVTPSHKWRSVEGVL